MMRLDLKTNIDYMHTPGLYGWMGIFSVVAAWDICGPQTLSEYARSHPLLTWVGGGIIMGHLLGVIPEKYDLIDWIGKGMIAVKPKHIAVEVEHYDF